MIQANELRLGNLVHDKEGQIVKVQAIFEEGVNDDHSDCDFWATDLQPIHLTDKVLIKCGFVFDQYYTHKDLNMFDITPTDEGFMLTINGYEYETDCVIKSLHQLQNLFFALSGKELEIKL